MPMSLSGRSLVGDRQISFLLGLLSFWLTAHGNGLIWKLILDLITVMYPPTSMLCQSTAKYTRWGINFSVFYLPITKCLALCLSARWAQWPGREEAHWLWQVHESDASTDSFDVVPWRNSTGCLWHPLCIPWKCVLREQLKAQILACAQTVQCPRGPLPVPATYSWLSGASLQPSWLAGAEWYHFCACVRGHSS